MYVCMYVYMCFCECVCVCARLRLYLSVSVCLRMYVCVCVSGCVIYKQLDMHLITLTNYHSYSIDFYWMIKADQLLKDN